MGATTERVLNRSPLRRGGPPWLNVVLQSIVPLWVFLVAMVIAFGPPYPGWLLAVYTAYCALLALIVWGRSIRWIEVGPDRITVGRPFSPRVAPLADVRQVDVHRNDWVYGLYGRRQAYTVDVWLASRRPWHLDHIESGAKDRLLATLHRHQKPIWVYLVG